MFIIYADLLSYVTPNGIFLPVSGTFCLKSISNNTGAAVFVKYVFCICVACLEAVGLKS